MFTQSKIMLIDFFYFYRSRKYIEKFAYYLS